MLLVRPGSDDEMMPYERLLGDAIRGDSLLFVREDGVEAAWGVVDPILGNVTPVHEYEPNTWGPVQTEQIMSGDDCWHNPPADRRKSAGDESKMRSPCEVGFMMDTGCRV